MNRNQNLIEKLYLPFIFLQKVFQVLNEEMTRGSGSS
jgi:hypothetical protein